MSSGNELARALSRRRTAVDSEGAHFTNKPSSNSVDATWNETEEAASTPRTLYRRKRGSAPAGSLAAAGQSPGMVNRTAEMLKAGRASSARKAQDSSTGRVTVDLTNASPAWRASGSPPRESVESRANMPASVEIHQDLPLGVPALRGNLKDTGATEQLDLSPCRTPPAKQPVQAEVMRMYEGDAIGQAGLAPPVRVDHGTAPKIIDLLDTDCPWEALSEHEPWFRDFVNARRARCRRSVLEEWRRIVRPLPDGLDLAGAVEGAQNDEGIVETFLIKSDIEAMWDQLKQCESYVTKLRQDAFTAELRSLQQEAELAALRERIASEGDKAKKAALDVQAQIERGVADRVKAHDQELESLRTEVASRVKRQEAELEALKKEAERLSNEVTTAHTTLSKSPLDTTKASHHVEHDGDDSDGGSTRCCYSARLPPRSSATLAVPTTSTVPATASSISPTEVSISTQMHGLSVSHSASSMAFSPCPSSVYKVAHGGYGQQHFQTAAQAETKTVHTVQCCPRAHPLTRFLTPQPGYTCDRCHCKQASSSAMYGCRQCNYDVCSACYASRDRPATDPSPAIHVSTVSAQPVDVPVQIVQKVSHVPVQVEVLTTVSAYPASAR